MELFDEELAAELSGDENVPPEHIAGVRCDAANCAYHDGERFCTAPSITVGCARADDKTETFCCTFERREMGTAN